MGSGAIRYREVARQAFNVIENGQHPQVGFTVHPWLPRCPLYLRDSCGRCRICSFGGMPASDGGQPLSSGGHRRSERWLSVLLPERSRPFQTQRNGLLRLRRLAATGQANSLLTPVSVTDSAHCGQGMRRLDGVLSRWQPRGHLAMLVSLLVAGSSRVRRSRMCDARAVPASVSTSSIRACPTASMAEGSRASRRAVR
jgi:hypothetical protein